MKCLDRRNFLGLGLAMLGVLGFDAWTKKPAKATPIPGDHDSMLRPHWWRVPFKINWGQVEFGDEDYCHYAGHVVDKHIALVYAKAEGNGEINYKEIYNILALSIDRTRGDGILYIDVTEPAALLLPASETLLVNGHTRIYKNLDWEKAAFIADLTEDHIRVIKNRFGPMKTIERLRCD
jgi:hypothetical protein